MAYTALYITTTDITDSVARDFVSNTDSRLDIWMENTDLNLQALALSLGVQKDSIYTPLNYYVKEFCIAYWCFQAFQDGYGENDVEQDSNDIYKIKLEYYANKVEKLRAQISREMILQEMQSLSNTNMVSCGVIYRA